MNRVEAVHSIDFEMLIILLKFQASLFYRVNATIEFCEGIVTPSDLTTSQYGALKKKLHNHLSGCGSSGPSHVNAVMAKKDDEDKLMRTTDVIKKQLIICLTTIKMKSPAVGYESILNLLSSLDVDVGSIKHSRLELVTSSCEILTYETYIYIYTYLLIYTSMYE